MGWLTGWIYQKEVTLTEQSSGAYSDYPTIITAAYDAHMKSDFADCRFTESDGTTLIPYGIVAKTDDVSCTFVIKRDYTSGCSLTVYLYYGKADAADASVDHGPWALAWYLANGFGQSSSAPYGGCSVYRYSASEDIPAWADVIFGGCTANGRSQCYGGRVKINGVAVEWASTDICNGITVAYQLKWKKYYCATSQYDHGSFVAGASNTVTWGHNQAGDPGFWVSYYPTDPSVSFGNEEAQEAADLIAKFEVGQNARNLPAEFVVGQWQKNLHAQFDVQQETSVDLHAVFAGQTSVDLLGAFAVRHPSSTDLLAGFRVRQPASIDLAASFEGQVTRDLLGKFFVNQWQEDLLGGFIVRHSSWVWPQPWLLGWAHQKSHTITGSVAGAQTNYPIGIKVYYGPGTDGTEIIGGATFGKIYCDSKCRGDFGDIRFTKSDETSLLDYWIEEQVDSDYAIIWVEVDSIPASPSTVDIYIYYGNTGASTTSNGDDTWLIFNDCTTTDGWSEQYVVGTPLWGTAIMDGATTIYIEANAHEEKLRIQYDAIISTGREDRRCLTRVKHTNWNQDGYFYWYTPLALSPSTQYDALRYASYYDDYTIYASVGGVSDTIDYAVAHPSGWYRYEKKTNAAGEVTAYRDDTDLGTATVDGDYSGGKVMYYVNEWNPGTTKHYIDWFAVGKYVDPEPTHTAWGPETSAIAAGGILPAQFFVKQWQEDLPARFDVGQDSVELSGEFDARHETSVDLLGEFSVRQMVYVDLHGEFIIKQWQEDLRGEFVIWRKASEDLLGKFTVKQWQEDLRCRFRVENIYDLRGTAGIAFYWQGADNPPESIVDFIVESPTGFWVAEFYDGPASLRYVFIPWTQFRETGLDGTRPDMSRVDGFIWIVHTDGMRLIDYIHAPVFGDLYAFFNVRHTAPRNLKAGFAVRRTATPLNLTASFVVRHVGTPLNLLAELAVRQESNVEVLGKFSVN